MFISARPVAPPTLLRGSSPGGVSSRRGLQAGAEGTLEPSSALGGQTLPPEFEGEMLPPNVTIDMLDPTSENYVPGVTRNYLVEDRTDLDFCDLGFICFEGEQANCTRLQILTVVWGLGDIHAGLYCPYNESNYLNCPAGSYCINSTTIQPCPKGMFCPHKTAVPEIECGTCNEGATTLYREKYGYTILIFLAVVACFYIFYKVMRRYREEQVQKLLSMAGRRVDSVRNKSYQRGQKKRLERIKPQLELISSRLRVSNSSTNSEEIEQEIPKKVDPSGAIRISSDGQISFNVARLFDEVDVNNDGTLTYSELNTILQLDGVQLREFVRRMNVIEHAPRGQPFVSRATFCRHFVRVLTETSYLRPNSAEAGELFDEIAKEQGTNRYGDIEPQSFYLSSLSSFLSDSQINDLIIRLRSHQVHVALEGSGIGATIGWAGGSLIGGGEGGSLIGRGGSRIGRRVSEKRQYRAIMRETFVKHYPECLIDVVSEPAPLSMVSTRMGIESVRVEPGSREVGVDIAFENLSLTVKVGDKDINVVDNVTGRLRAGTMVRVGGMLIVSFVASLMRPFLFPLFQTALMGGSGAGECKVHRILPMLFMFLFASPHVSH